MGSFLAWEANQPTKWEFDGIRPIAMTGGTIAHSLISGNIIRSLNNRLAGGPCRAMGPDLQIRTSKTVRYPDAAVTCSPLLAKSRFFPDPIVIFEVSSDSTATDDRTTKLAEYRALASVQRYVMIEQDRAFATVIVRSEVAWQHVLVGRGGMLEMPELGIEVPMAELYDGLTLDEVSSPVER